LVLALLGAIIYLRRKRISFLKVADICAPSIALGIFLTRIGCFLSGCCFGSPTGCPLGVSFPADSPAGFLYPGSAVHPAQLYSSFYGIAIFLLLVLFDRRRLRDGFLFALLCILYGAARFTIDFFRYYDESAMMTATLTVNQGISVALALFGLVLLFVLPKGDRAPRG
jgi:phosphatidylglycerol:prolipoprotein diacylglycerol transferase